MKNYIKIGDRKIELSEESARNIEEQFKEKKSYKRWRADVGGVYYHSDGGDFIYTAKECRDSIDESHYNSGNYFKTKEEAEQYSRYRILTQKIKDRIAELNEGWTPDWSNETERKFLIYRSYIDAIFSTSNHYYYQSANSSLFLKSKELAEQIIEEFGDDLMVLFK